MHLCHGSCFIADRHCLHGFTTRDTSWYHAQVYFIVQDLPHVRGTSYLGLKFAIFKLINTVKQTPLDTAGGIFCFGEIPQLHLQFLGHDVSRMHGSILSCRKRHFCGLAKASLLQLEPWNE